MIKKHKMYSEQSFCVIITYLSVYVFVNIYGLKRDR